jgi:flagellar protein FliO/FliZ
MDKLNQKLAQGQSERDATDTDSTPVSDSAPLSMFYLLLRGVAATAFVLGLILLLGYMARRFGGKSPLLAGAGLGSVIGRVYLAKGAALYYVRTGGRVLVVGVTNTTMSLVGEFDAAAFDDEDAEMESRFPSEPDPDAFLSQLRGSSSAMRSAEEGDFTGDMEIDSLKGDIRRLQSLLEEESHETRS